MHNPSTQAVRRSVIVLALIFPLLVAAAELPPEDANSWTLRKETDAIRVYTMDQPDSSFQAFKAVAMLDVPIENLMAVMVNPKSCVEWVHNCSESHAFGEGDFYDRYAYSVNNMPWPVADRDYVLRIRTHGSREDGEIVMDLNAVPQRLDNKEGLVRVDSSDTYYRFVPMGDQTRMVWIQHTDPNGAIPGWLVNSLLVDIPIKSMEQLERVAGKTRYQNYELVYDEEGKLTAVVPGKTEPKSGDDDS
jgi:START domain-containing protein